jgi:hypothetical protein
MGSGPTCPKLWLQMDERQGSQQSASEMPGDSLARHAGADRGLSADGAAGGDRPSMGLVGYGGDAALSGLFYRLAFHRSGRLPRTRETLLTLSVLARAVPLSPMQRHSEVPQGNPSPHQRHSTSCPITPDAQRQNSQAPCREHSRYDCT